MLPKGTTRTKDGGGSKDGHDTDLALGDADIAQIKTSAKVFFPLSHEEWDQNAKLGNEQVGVGAKTNGSGGCHRYEDGGKSIASMVKELTKRR
jgi:hypothetical protein